MPCKYRASNFNSQASYEARPHIGFAATISTVFQFTGLIRGPTDWERDFRCQTGISIHRPHTRPDGFPRPTIHLIHYFNSQASYEARQNILFFSYAVVVISIHRPHTRPDLCLRKYHSARLISIHRPHTRPDLQPVDVLHP